MPGRLESFFLRKTSTARLQLDALDGLRGAAVLIVVVQDDDAPSWIALIARVDVEHVVAKLSNPQPARSVKRCHNGIRDHRLASE